MAEQEKSEKEKRSIDLAKILNSTAPVTVLFTDFIFLVVLGIITWLILRVASDPSGREAVPINALVSLLGALCGWVVGTGLAPYTAAEGRRFREISVTASAFLSGYIVSKLERLLDAALLQQPAQHAVAWERAGLFLAAFLATVITVFINRFYSPTTKALDVIDGAKTTESAQESREQSELPRV
ncbi:MAG TPA: hypothetical protein VN617_04705 [Rhodoferax sp.]|nr:hypothetical protein [Rhodoferax sp.]